LVSLPWRSARSAWVAVLATIAICISVTNVEARPYTLEWDANTDGVTVGYRVYYGTAPETYQPAEGIDVDNATQFQVDLLPGATYYFAVRGYNSDDELGPPSAELSFFVPVVGLSLSLPSPQVPGTQITVNATGLAGNFEYQFVRRNPAGVWSIVQAYSTATSFVWNTTAAPAGAYMVQVWARPVGTSVAYDTWAGIAFELVATAPPPVTAVALGANVASPQITGAAVTFTANATGTTGNYEYQFILRNPAGVWSVVQPYSSTSNWVWNTGSVGAYFLQVWARNIGSTNAYEAFIGMPFDVVSTPAGPVTAVAVTTNLASPQTVGTQVMVTANATGTSGNYQYQFVLRNPAGVWTIVQPYSSSPSWTWNTAALSAGNYFIQVWARNAGSNSAYEAYIGMPFDLVLTPMSPVTSVALSPNMPSPQNPGAQVIFTASATGTTGNYQYQYLLRNPAGVWTVVQAYSSTPTWTWNTTGGPSGAYFLQVWARNTGSASAYEAYIGYAFTIN
jgi:hypothetical protein